MPDEISDTREWTLRAACIPGDPDALFVQGAAQHRAKIVCMGCEVRTECLAEALDNRIEFGVWGGMTERERRALLRRRPDISSWAQLLFQARDDHMAQQVIDLRSATRSRSA
ncbi:MAG: WhiB family transcriptional regulator [Actinobacteria bacterium]|nr:WhiB family transcriptional regulator [Actinomycetota bacterium]